MLILNDTFPITTQQLYQLLNSNIINWLFKSLFTTHKVLRSDLEALPIHVHYFDKNSKFSEESYLNYLNIENANGTFRIKK